MRLNFRRNLARINGARLNTIAIANFKNSFGKRKSIYMEETAQPPGIIQDQDGRYMEQMVHFQNEFTVREPPSFFQISERFDIHTQQIDHFPLTYL